MEKIVLVIIIILGLLGLVGAENWYPITIKKLCATGPKFGDSRVAKAKNSFVLLISCRLRAFLFKVMTDHTSRANKQ
jgi:hypothetical protein